MKFSEHWLRELANPALSSKALADTLTMAGLEVEAIEPVAAPFSGVVVARVLEVARHPEADRLSVCVVDAGGEAPLDIVCGAPNVERGMLVPCARAGAALPGLEIRAASVRGVESKGMLCSAKELGLSDDHSGLLALPADAPIGTDVRELLDLDDTLLTLKLTPNRGDCLSMYGLGREVSIITGAQFVPAPCPPVPATLRERREVTLEDREACPLYLGRIIRGVNARAATPTWMSRRLERSGLRSISAIVDVTNYVMLELGQPLHAFDNERITGAVSIRRARDGERLTLLNGQDIELDRDLLLIADADKPLALAGIMGGLQSEISLDTTEVFLEAAFFAPKAIAGRPRRLGMTSDASYRFERGVDYGMTARAMERATRLVIDICGGEAGPVTHAQAELPARQPIVLRTDRVAKILGVSLGEDQIGAILDQLGFDLSRQTGTFAVTPPSHRFDIEIEEDLIEEVARIYGYERIPTAPSRAPLAMLSRPERRRSIASVKRTLTERDYFEVINYSFIDAQWEADFSGNPAPIMLANPIAAQMNAMRSSLIGGLVANLRTNLSRKTERVRIFEVGRCFLRSLNRSDAPLAAALAVEGYDQPLRIGGLAYGNQVAEQWGARARRVDFFDVKGDVEALLAPLRAVFEPSVHPALHPGRCAGISLGGMVIGWLGELHPKWVQQYELVHPAIVFELELDPLLMRTLPQYQQVSKFPPVVRDLAVVVADSIPSSALLEAIRAARLATVKELELFDLYRGEGIEKGRKSLAFRVVMQDTARTLTDAEADQTMNKIRSILAARFDAKPRA